MRHLLPITAALAILVPEAPALACGNAMQGSDGRYLLALGIAGAIAHGCLLPLMTTRAAKLWSLASVGLGVVVLNWALGLPESTFGTLALIGGYAILGSVLGAGLVRPRKSAKKSEAETEPLPEDRASDDRAA